MLVMEHTLTPLQLEGMSSCQDELPGKHRTSSSILISKRANNILVQKWPKYLDVLILKPRHNYTKHWHIIKLKKILFL